MEKREWAREWETAEQRDRERELKKKKNPERTINTYINHNLE